MVIYKTFAIDGAGIVRISAQGYTKKESLQFCKMDLIEYQVKRKIADYWNLSKFKFETIKI
jgi:hypothetical protein